ncbi:MAG: site-specific DNA-methyltransferase [Muribaculaceae bacterium]|nr:site-specific DNA-methyltransferase [Muribaculaceae bacterium]
MQKHETVAKTIAMVFQKSSQFTLRDAYAAVPDAPEHSVRARLHDGVASGQFIKLARGVYAVGYAENQGAQCVLLQGDGRDLSFLPDSSVDCIVTDHPYEISGQLKGGNRDFASYDLFQYTQGDMAEKYRVLKDGHFLVEFLPEESAENFEYITRVKQMALQAGFLYYAKVPWEKSGFVANTGRKSKDAEDVCFFTKGRPRAMRPDAKKDKAEPGVRHFMSGASGMLPTRFRYAPPDKKSRIHQAEKPAGLLQAILDYVTYQGECVLDQFAGSGSTGEACLNSGRDCVLIEKSLDFVARIADRLALKGAVAHA